MPDAPSEPVWSIEKIGPHHDRAGFGCGHESLDVYLKQYARQNQESGISRTYVAVRPGRKEVQGYYSVSSGAVVFEQIPDERRKGLPRYPIPVAHLGRLAVDREAGGQGLGELLLMDAFERIVRIADEVGMHAVEVVAIDESARRFYLKYGFTSLADDPLHMYIPIRMLRRAGFI